MNRRKALAGIGAIAVVTAAGIPEGTKADLRGVEKCTTPNCYLLAIADTEEHARHEFRRLHGKVPEQIRLSRCYLPNTTMGEWGYIASSKCTGYHAIPMMVGPYEMPSYQRVYKCYSPYLQG